MIIIYILSSHIRNKPENHCTPFSESTGPLQWKGQKKLQARMPASLPLCPPRTTLTKTKPQLSWSSCVMTASTCIKRRQDPKEDFIIIIILNKKVNERSLCAESLGPGLGERFPEAWYSCLFSTFRTNILYCE